MDHRILALFVILPAVLASAVSCGGGDDGRTAIEPSGGQPSPASGGSPLATISITSDAFRDNENIPVRYTCDGENISPQLAWSGGPAGTAAYALIMHDPDAPRSGGYTHWVVYDIPSGVTSLASDSSPGGDLPSGARQGKNSAGKNEYTGPCPPRGSPHHYNFTIYAVDEPLRLEAGESNKDIEEAVRGHVLAEGRLTGLYGRN